MGLTLSKAQQMLDRYVEAELEVLDGRTVSFGGRTLSMVDLPDIRSGRQEWERKVAGLQRAARGQALPYKLAVFE